MQRPIIFSWVVVGSLAVSAPALADGNPERGKKVFNVVDAEKNRVGPHLIDPFGRSHGSLENFTHSRAMQGAQIIWGEETLDAYLENLRKYVKGTQMAFAGLKKDDDRQNVIAYLRQVTAKK